MRSLKSLVLIVTSFFLVPGGWADSLRISQIDTIDLLPKQKITLYLSVTNDSGIPIEGLHQSQFRVLESTKTQAPHSESVINSFQAGINFTRGVSFLLLMDNSESMYWTLEGEKTQHTDQRRITIAQKAVLAFLRSIRNPLDKVGLATYNSYYSPLSKPTNDIAGTEQLMKSIQRPTGDAIYSEIYGSVALAVEDFNTIIGRKAIIILSDGVNNPSYNHTRKINAQFGQKYVPFHKPLEALQREGISLYVINFGRKGDQKDRQLTQIASQSGGATFDAHNQQELNKVYRTITNQIQKEYVLTYTAGMEPADKTFVKVTYTKGAPTTTATRYYISGTVFGLPQEAANPIILLLFPISCLLLWLLSKIRFEKQRKNPSIEVLNAGAGKFSTQVLDLGSGETIIGSAPTADMTIAGLPTIEGNHATIIFDEKKNHYLLSGKGKMMVNNKQVTTKVLEPGDLINIDGTTMVFDEGTD